MGLFDQIRKKAGAASKGAAVSASAPAESAEPVLKAGTSARVVADVLRRPRVTEKAARLAERGTYVFDVPIAAEKRSIKRAVESLYQVKVDAVRTVRGTGKAVRRGRVQGRRSAWKKALVTLAPDQKIDLYAGV